MEKVTGDVQSSSQEAKSTTTSQESVTGINIDLSSTTENMNGNTKEAPPKGEAMNENDSSQKNKTNGMIAGTNGMTAETSAQESRHDSHSSQTEKTNGNQEESATACTPCISRADRHDQYSVKVKSPFVLTDRSPTLPPLRPEVMKDVVDETKRGKSKKKRPRDSRIAAEDKVCMAIIRGDSCPFGDDCKFSHDVKAYLVNRPPGIIEKVEGGCPTYRLTGYCSFGAMCRLGESHMNMATGENLRMNPPPVKLPPPVMNSLKKDTTMQLRRKKYPFKTKRHFQKHNKEPTETKEVNIAVETSMSPLPSTRKLIDFSNKVYVAPLTTVGNLPFRRIMKKFGADITCGEMALSTNLIQGQPSEWALLKRHAEEDVFGVQIAAGYPDQFSCVAEIIEAEMDVDFVDLNLGCPLDLVCNKGAGAALMSRDKQLKSTLQSITSTLSCPVTIKMRTGWDISKPFAHDLVRKIQGWNIGGIGAVMVHGRSRLQRYSKEADWDYIQRVAQTHVDAVPQIPVIGNGDIFSYADYENKVLSRPDILPCAMLGRGALIKPWLPTEIKQKRVWDISSSERLDFLKEFVKFGLEHWGSDQQGVNNCRRFLLEWLSFLHRYVPVGLMEMLPQQMNQRLPAFMSGRDELETLMLSPHSSDWIHISEMLLGPVPDGFRFEPKHKAKAYATNS